MNIKVEYINDNTPNLAVKRNPIIINWLKQYLRSSYRKGSKYLHYNGIIFAYIRYDNKLYVICPFFIAKIGLRNFKKYCRTNKHLV